MMIPIAELCQVGRQTATATREELLQGLTDLRLSCRQL